MTDSRIKKVIVNSDRLPGVGSDNKYLVRFRVVSEDRNRFSHWSPIYSVDNLPISSVSGTVNVNGSFTAVIWGDELSWPKYDVFVKFDDGEYFYHGTSVTHTYSFINTGSTSVQVAIQVEGFDKSRSSTLTIYESGIVPLV